MKWSTIVHFIAIGAGAALVAVGTATGQTWLTILGTTLGGLAGMNGTANVTAIGDTQVVDAAPKKNGAS